MAPATAIAAPPLMTADEFLRKHGSEKSVELVDGQIVRYPMPGGPHGYVANNISVLLTPFIREKKLGRVFSCDTFFRTRTDPDRVRGADLAFVSYQRMPPGPIPDGMLPTVPELVFEVRSPSDSINDMTSKATEYIAAGVTVVIVLDPKTESAAIYREHEFPQVRHNGDELTIPDVLPGFAVTVRAFFE